MEKRLKTKDTKQEKTYRDKERTYKKS